MSDLSLQQRLQRIQDLQPNAVAAMRRHGFVMDVVGPLADDASEVDRWKVLAFSFYTDLVEASMIAEHILESDYTSDLLKRAVSLVCDGESRPQDRDQWLADYEALAGDDA